MFVDELTITAKAGNGGDGVVRWRREKFIPKGGPAGGNGGKGGDVYMRAVRDLNLLSKYTGAKEFCAADGNPGEKKSKYGKDGEDVYIDIPVGATVTEQERDRTYTFAQEGDIVKILRGGRGGLGNEHFKSSTNRTPQESTKGQSGESGTFTIELSLIVDVGLIGLPNAGKSMLLNTLTQAKSRVGAYPFTTVEPHLGELYGFIIADIPGLIEGAGEGKGLGHKFLKHVARTKMLLHCVSLEEQNPYAVYEQIRNELAKFDQKLLDKEEWVILTKADTCDLEVQRQIEATFAQRVSGRTLTISALEETGIKELKDALTQHLRQLENKALE